MHILYPIIYICPFPGFGGTQEYTLQLAMQAAKYTDVFLLMPFDKNQHGYLESINKLNITPVRIPDEVSSNINAKSYFRRVQSSILFAQFIRSQPWWGEKKYILHSSLNPISFSIIGMYLLKRVIAINTFHDFGNITARSISFFINSVFLSLGTILGWRFIIPSQAIKSDLLSYVSILPESRIFIINTGIKKIYRLKKPKNTKFKLVMIGRVEQAKAWQIWLDAIQICKGRLINHNFEWHGAGTDLNDANILLKQKKLVGIASFCGAFESFESVLRTADVFVLSSRWEGGCLPRSVLQAMFSGVPCILPNLPSITESIGGKNCCIFYEPGDPDTLAKAFILASSSPDLLKMISANARKHVCEFHTDVLEVTRTMHLYNSLNF